MNIKKAISLLTTNPRLFFKLLVKRLSCRMLTRWFLPKSPVQKRINGVLFEFDFDIGPYIKKMYFGFYEIETIEVMKTVLESGDIFINAGASIGYLSAIGAGLVGKNGEVHSFEPVPQYVQRLKHLAATNPDYKIIVNQHALGEEGGMANINISASSNFGWNTMVPNYMRKEMIKETLAVPVYRLDNYIKQKGLNNISLIKIDVEGFEFPVLRGLSNYFRDIDHRPVIICELQTSVYPLLGYTVTQLLEYMERYNYNAYSLMDTNVEVDITELKDITDVVFLPSA